MMITIEKTGNELWKIWIRDDRRVGTVSIVQFEYVARVYLRETLYVIEWVKWQGEVGTNPEYDVGSSHLTSRAALDSLVLEINNKKRMS